MDKKWRASRLHLEPEALRYVPNSTDQLGDYQLQPLIKTCSMNSRKYPTVPYLAIINFYLHRAIGAVTKSQPRAKEGDSGVR